MKNEEIASLACKVLGIFLIIQGTNVVSNSLYYSMSSINTLPKELILNVVFSSIYIVFGVLLWLLSDRLSGLMVKDESHADKGEGIRTNNIQRIAFSVLGLYFIGHSLPRLVSSLLNMYSSFNGIPDSKVIMMLSLGGEITELIIGLGIFLGSQGLVNFLNLLGNAGVKRE